MNDRELPEWQRKRKSDQLWISPSQLSVFTDTCERKWWLKSVRKLAEPYRKATGFGTVLASCLERWYNADDNGYDRKTGEPVDIYPNGWEIAENKFGDDAPPPPLSALEQKMAMDLIAAAEDAGVITRDPGRQAEAEFKIELCTHKGVTVFFIGSMDVRSYMRVEDHKTVKTMKYALSPAKLRKDTQLLSYAGVVLLEEDRKRGTPVPDDEKIQLAHNYFCKDPDNMRVEKRPVSVPVKTVRSFWSRMIDNTKRMVEVRTNTDQYISVKEGDPWKACKKYGGCPYIHICNGTETPLAYQKRNMSKKQQEAAHKTTTTVQPTAAIEKPKNNMAKSLQELLASKKAAAKSKEGTKATQQKAAPKTGLNRPAKKQPETPATSPASSGIPPWAREGIGCTACRNLPNPGFMRDGKVCPVCKSTSKSRGIVVDDHFEITEEAGKVTWSLKDEFIELPVYLEWMENGGDVYGEVVFGDTSVKAKVKEEEPEPEAAPEPEEQPEEEPAQEEEPEEEPEEDAEPSALPKTQELKGNSAPKKVSPSKAGRPRASFKMIIGTSISKFPNAKRGTGKAIVNGDEIVQAGMDQIAEENGVGSFFELDPFQRRDALRLYAETVAVPKFCEDKDYILFPSAEKESCETGTVIAALRPHAELIIG